MIWNLSWNRLIVSNASRNGASLQHQFFSSFRIGVDSISAHHQFLFSLRTYPFNFEIYDVEAIISYLERLQDIDDIERYESLIQEESYLFKDLINVEDTTMNERVQLFSNQSNIKTS